MRFSLLLAGASAVSALSVPEFVKRQELVDLNIFHGHKFPLLSPEQAAADATKGNADFNPDLVVKPEQAAPKVASSGGDMGNMRIAAAGVSTAAAAKCTNPKIRYEWRKLTVQHRKDFVNAVKCLQNSKKKTNLASVRNRLDDLTALHQKYSSSIHGVGKFLPWHRYYLYVFESLLRDECKYTGPMTWWDETKDAGKFNKAPMFTTDYFGRAPLKTAAGKGTCIQSGKFANTQLPIGPGQGHQQHCLSRAVNEKLSREVTMSFVNSCNSHANYTDMWKCSYLGPHAYGHNAVGAVMSDIDTSPGDPIFFLHHAFIDRNWRIWQNVNKKTRLYQISGYTTEKPPYKPTTLDTPLYSYGVRPDAKVRDVMDTMGGFLCYKYDY